MSSSYYTVGEILELLHLNSPYRKIIDLGSGFGKYGVLLRVFLEKEPHIPSSWLMQIDAVEIFTDYVNANYAFYSNISNDNIMDVDISDYDLVLMIDVIEHLAKKDALLLLQKITGRVIIVTPNGFSKQKDLHNNPYQIHHCGFTVKEFKRLGFTVKKIRGEIIAHNLRFTRKPLRHKIIPYRIRSWIKRKIGV